MQKIHETTPTVWEVSRYRKPGGFTVVECIVDFGIF